MSEANGNGNGNGHVPAGEMHAVLKQALEDLLPGMLAAHQGPVPQVPAPPVAAVHRPSGWHAPAAPAPGPAAAAPAPAAGGAVEHVRLQGDRDLDAFVRSLAKRLEHPAERAAILSGRIRFTMGAGGHAAAAPAAPAGDAHRVERGAVTERVVERAAAAGQALVLGPRAVLTPMGRDRARALGVQIQRETAC